MSEIHDGSRLRGLHKDTKALIQMAINLGWKAVQQSSGAIRLLPPEGHDIPTIRIPLSTKPFTGMSRARKAVMSTASGAQVASLAAVVDDVPGYDPEDSVVRGLAYEDDIDVEALVEPEEPPARRTHHEPEPYIVATAPWMARKAPRKDGGLLYESNAVRARTWSDGTVDYVCAEPDCGWTSDNPVSVARHYGGTHSRGKGEQPIAEPTTIDPDYTEPVNHRGYQPTERMINLIMEQIVSVMDLRMSERDMAVAILTFLHDRPDLPDPTPAAPLTAEQILDRIRVLVDKDPVARQLDEAQRQMREAINELEEARNEINRLHTEREALRDLLS